MSSAVAPVRNRGLFRAIDWRLVAAVGLPVWTFLFGLVIAHKPAPAPPPPVPEPVEVAVNPAPTPQVPPGEVVRTEVVRQEVGVPVAFPIPVPIPIVTKPLAEPVALVQPAPPAAPPVAPVEFRLPDSEVMPGDRCKTFNTKIHFHPDLAAAADAAKQSKKLLLVLHISGNFEDPGFT